MEYVRILDKNRPTDDQLAAKRLRESTKKSAASALTGAATTSSPSTGAAATSSASNLTMAAVQVQAQQQNEAPAQPKQQSAAEPAALASAPPTTTTTTTSASTEPKSLFSTKNPALHRPVSAFPTIIDMRQNLQEFCIGGRIIGISYWTEKENAKFFISVAVKSENAIVRIQFYGGVAEKYEHNLKENRWMWVFKVNPQPALKHKLVSDNTQIGFHSLPQCMFFIFYCHKNMCVCISVL